MSAGLRRATAADAEVLAALQQRAYARNRALIGRDPLPLTWDYDAVVRDWEVWLAEADGRLQGALILNWRVDDLYIESIAVDPATQSGGLGRSLLAHAHARAREGGRGWLRLLTNARFTNNIAWYERAGFAIERREELGDRVIIHMAKPLPEA